MNNCLDIIILRLTNINKEISNIKDTDASYISDLITLETNANFKIVYLTGEYWTIANIIARYCYLEDNDIEFVCSSITHPTTEISKIRIKHKTSI